MMCWEMRGHLWRIYNPSAVQAHTNSEGVMGNRSVGENRCPPMVGIGRIIKDGGRRDVTFDKKHAIK